MDMTQLFKLATGLSPLVPRLEKAAVTVGRLQADPDVQDAIAVAKEAIAVVEGILNPPAQSG
jgi:hypothetical protein